MCWRMRALRARARRLGAQGGRALSAGSRPTPSSPRSISAATWCARCCSRSTARVPVRAVRATRGKWLRAEPVAAMYAQGKVKHVGAALPRWKTRCADFGLDGLSSGRSPDRLDALVWAVTDLGRARRAAGPAHSRLRRAASGAAVVAAVHALARAGLTPADRQHRDIGDERGTDEQHPVLADEAEQIAITGQPIQHFGRVPRRRERHSTLARGRTSVNCG